MTAIQLNLWDGKPSIEPEQYTYTLGLCPRDLVTNSLNLDPCRGCPLHDICAPDDCAMKCYDIDVPEPELYTFEDWLSSPL